MDKNLSFFDDDDTGRGGKYKENCLERAEREHVKENIEQFQIMQKLPYKSKLVHACKRAKEFYSEITSPVGDYYGNVHVSVGGLDSITLLVFLREMCGIDCPAISVSGLEDISIQRIHNQLGVIRLSPSKDADGKTWTKHRILQEYGFPVLEGMFVKAVIAPKVFHHPQDRIKFLDKIRGQLLQFEAEDDE